LNPALVAGFFYVFCTDTLISRLTRLAHPHGMLTELYIEALLVDEELADQVWEVWNVGVIKYELPAWAWWSILAEGH
jgi:hypothetical protein